MLEFTRKCKFDADLFTTPPRPKSTAITTVPTNCLPKSAAEAIKATWTGEGSVVDEGQWRKRFAEGLLRSMARQRVESGFEAQTFSSAEEFLASESLANTTCLVLDVAMPGMTGPDLQRGRP